VPQGSGLFMLTNMPFSERSQTCPCLSSNPGIPSLPTTMFNDVLRRTKCRGRRLRRRLYRRKQLLRVDGIDEISFAPAVETNATVGRVLEMV